MTGRALSAIVLLSAIGAIGCGPSPAPDLDAGNGADLPTSIFDCDPACATGYTCDDGTCVPACEPNCPVGTRCADDGECYLNASDDPAERLARNPCGGYAELPGLPGEDCGPCGTGRWLCMTDNVVTCADPVGLNACGSCGELPSVPGAVCGDEQRWACTPELDLECVPWFDANPCLGTAPLETPPARSCGECGAGYSTCVGNNETRCVEGADDVPCECDPESSPPLPCGTSAGICTRGLRFCQADGRYGSCVEAWEEGTCDDGGTCDGGVCVTERIHPYESLDDDCVRPDDAACERRVCRHLDAGGACASDSDCRPSQGCGDGVCTPLVVRPVDELCNGLDDDCDGKIDNDERRTSICGACPFNMMLVTNAAREFGRRRICIDIYEASRPDATETDAGSDERYSASHWKRIPWHAVDAAEAVSACAGDEFNAQVPGGVPQKRLCVIDEWQLACNIEGRAFPYGDEFRTGICHDSSHGGDGPVSTTEYVECSHLVPGGRFPNHDFTGNVEEWVRADGGVMLAGGSYRDGVADALSCGSVRPWDGEPGPWLGFRCCAATATVTEFME